MGVKLAHILLRLLWAPRGESQGCPGQEPPPAPRPVGPPLTRDGRKGGSTRRARRSSQLTCRKKGCLCGQSAPKRANISRSVAPSETPSALGPCPLHPDTPGGSALSPLNGPRPTCTSAASPGPPPIRWLGFRFRNCRTRAGGEGLGRRYRLLPSGPRGWGKVRKGSWLVLGALECGLHLLTPSGFPRFGPMAPSPQSLCWHHPRAHSWGSNSQSGWGA